jgi:hypothetical protein
MLFPECSERVEGRMRRRSRRAPNTSESTGKIGQEIPANQPAPLVPFYPDDAPARHTHPHPTHEAARPAPSQRGASKPQFASKPEWGEQQAGAGRQKAKLKQVREYN